MSKDFGNNIGRVLEEELEIADDIQVGCDLVVVEPTAPKDVVVPDEMSDKDIIEDYAIVRSTLHEAIEQTGEVLKMATEMLRNEPDNKTITSITDLVKAQNISTEKLFDLHVKIAKETQRQNKIKDSEESTEYSVDDILDKGKK